MKGAQQCASAIFIVTEIEKKSTSLQEQAYVLGVSVKRKTPTPGQKPDAGDSDSTPLIKATQQAVRSHIVDKFVMKKIINFSLTVSCPVGCVPACMHNCTVQKFRLSVCPQGVAIKSTVSSGLQKHPMCAPTISITLMLRKAAWVNASVMLLFGLQNLCL